MNRADFTGQHALVEPAVARAQDRPSVGGEPCRDAETWRYHVPCIQRSQATDDPARLASCHIGRPEVLTDGPAVVKPHTGIDGQPFPHRHGIARECRHRDELAAAIGGRAGNRLERSAVVVDESDAAWNDDRLVVFPSFDLRADLPLVIRGKPRRAVVGERRFHRRADQRQRTDLWRTSARDIRHAIEPIRRRRIACTRVVLARKDEASGSHIPERVG